jgi:ABC-type transport system substrate-binding protein
LRTADRSRDELRTGDLVSVDSLIGRRFNYRLAALLVLLTSASANAASEKVLRYAFEVAETGFDPAQIIDLYSRNVTANVFDAPLRYAWLAPAGTLEPSTAASLPEISADFRTFTFTLKPGTYFADDMAFGSQRRELVAADYVYSLKRIADPRWKSPTWSEFEEVAIVGLPAVREEALKTGHFDYDREIAGLRALDRYRFRVTLERPNPRFAFLLADPSVVGAVAREVVERYGDRIMEHPVGTGPFRLTQWRRSSRIVLERNPEYREEFFPDAPDTASVESRQLAQRFHGRRLPMIDRVEISPIEESQPRWLAFLNGEHDFLDLMPRDLVSLALAGTRPTPVLLRKHVQVYRVPEIDVTVLAYNMEDPVIGGYEPERVALRRALNLGFNTDEVIASIYKYQASPAQTLIQPGTYGYDPALHTENGDYDPARANALLDVYGYRRGADGWRSRPDGSSLELEMNLEPDQQRRLLGEIVKKSFNALGVRVKFKYAKWPENLRMVQNGQFQIWYLGFSAAQPDSEDVFRLCYGPAIGSFDLSRIERPEYDRLFLASKQLPDGPERLELLHQLTALELVYAPMKAVSHRYRTDLAYPWVVGYHHGPFIRDWWRYVDIDTELQARSKQ